MSSRIPTVCVDLAGSRRSFFAAIMSFLLAGSTAPGRAGARRRGLSRDERAEEVRRLAWAGLIAAGGGESGLVAKAARLCRDDSIDLPTLLRVDAAQPDLRGIRPRNLPQAQATAALRRVLDEGQRRFERARQADLELVERHVRSEVGRLAYDIPTRDLLAHFQVPAELGSWFERPGDMLSSALQGLPELDVPPFLAGLAKGESIGAGVTEFVNETAEQVLDDLLKSVPRDLRSALATTDGIVAAFRHLNPARVDSVRKALDETVSVFSSSAVPGLPAASTMLVVGAISGLVSGIFTSGKLDAIQRELRVLNNRLGDMERTLGGLVEDVRIIKQQLDRIESQVGQVRVQLEDLRARFDFFLLVQANRDLRTAREEAGQSLDEVTGLPGNRNAAMIVLREALRIAGGGLCIARSKECNFPLAVKSDDVFPATEPLNGWLSYSCEGLARAMDALAGDGLQIPRPDDDPSFANPSVWLVGAELASRAACMLEPGDELPGGMTVRKALEKVADQGDVIQESLVRFAAPARLERVAERFLTWWSAQGAGGKLLLASLEEARREKKLLKPDKVANIRRLEDLKFEPYWSPPRDDRGPFPHVYYANVGADGWTQVLRPVDGDPIDARAAGDRKWIVEHGTFTYQRVPTGIAGQPRPSPQNFRQGRTATRTMKVKDRATGKLIASFTEALLDYTPGGQDTPTSALRYSTDAERSALDVLGAALVRFERDTGGLKKRLHEMVQRNLTNSPSTRKELIDFLGAIGGAITVSHWTMAEDLSTFSPPVVDGLSQVPATLAGYVGLLTDDDAYANPMVAPDEVLRGFSGRVRSRLDAARATAAEAAGRPGVPVIVRTAFDLRSAVI